jgi:hypothetical protein
MSKVGDFDHEPTGREAIREVREFLDRTNGTGYRYMENEDIVAELFGQEGNILFICQALEEAYNSE